MSTMVKARERRWERGKKGLKKGKEGLEEGKRTAYKRDGNRI